MSPDVNSRSPVPVFPPSSLEFTLFSCHDGVNCLLRNSESLNDFSVEYCEAARSKGSHGKFLLPRGPELAHNEDVERRMECLRNFVGYRHSATRKCQDHNVVPVRELAQLGSEDTDSFGFSS
jgi:hypothetical protein